MSNRKNEEALTVLVSWGRGRELARDRVEVGGVQFTSGPLFIPTPGQAVISEALSGAPSHSLAAYQSMRRAMPWLPPPVNRSGIVAGYKPTRSGPGRKPGGQLPWATALRRNELALCPDLKSKDLAWYMKWAPRIRNLAKVGADHCDDTMIAVYAHIYHHRHRLLADSGDVQRGWWIRYAVHQCQRSAEKAKKRESPLPDHLVRQALNLPQIQVERASEVFAGG